MASSETIQVSLPAYLLEEWDEEVEQLDMFRSEWIRYQVEAGRKQLAALDPQTEDTADDGLRQTVLDAVSDDEAAPADEVVTTVLNPIEEEIYDLLEELNDDGEIGYDPRNGGYRKR